MKSPNYYSLSTTNSFPVSQEIRGLSIPCTVCEERKWEFIYEGVRLYLPSADARKYSRSGWPPFIGSLHLFAVSRVVHDWIHEVGFSGLKLHSLVIEIESGEVSPEEYFIIEPTTSLNIEIPKEGFEICKECGVAAKKGYGFPTPALKAKNSSGEEVLDFYKCSGVYPNTALIGESAFDAMLEKWTGNKRNPKMRPIVTAICSE